MAAHPLGALGKVALVAAGLKGLRGASQQGDKVAISPLARQLGPAAKAAPASPTGEINLPAARSHHQANLAAFQERLGRLFTDYGIDTSQEVVLELDALGELSVANGHPDAQRIENLLDQIPGIKGQLQSLSGTSRLIANLEVNALAQASPGNERGRLLSQYHAHSVQDATPFRLLIPATAA
jgi:hypothetical protein